MMPDVLMKEDSVGWWLKQLVDDGKTAGKSGAILSTSFVSKSILCVVLALERPLLDSKKECKQKTNDCQMAKDNDHCNQRI